MCTHRWFLAPNTNQRPSGETAIGGTSFPARARAEARAIRPEDGELNGRRGIRGSRRQQERRARTAEVAANRIAAAGHSRIDRARSLQRTFRGCPRGDRDTGATRVKTAARRRSDGRRSSVRGLRALMPCSTSRFTVMGVPARKRLASNRQFRGTGAALLSRAHSRHRDHLVQAIVISHSGPS
jgi:hypothetical protein